MARDRKKEREDKNGENIAHQFLLENFYTKTEYFHECITKEEQLKGYDTTFSFMGLDYKCDEKAALDYVNKEYPLGTFCLELSYLDRYDNLREGWFTDPSEENNSYLFLWIDKAKTDKVTSKDDILEGEYMLVMKDDIKEYLQSIGWTDENLRKKCERIREGNDSNMGSYHENGCKFSFPQYLPEKPINILIKRNTYRKMKHTYCISFKKEKPVD